MESFQIFFRTKERADKKTGKASETPRELTPVCADGGEAEAKAEAEAEARRVEGIIGGLGLL